MRGFDDGRGIDIGRVLGSYQLDQFQAFQVGADAHSGGALDLYGELQALDFTSNPLPEAGSVRPRFRNDAQGSSSAIIPKSDGTNGIPRTGADTHVRGYTARMLVRY